MRLARVIMILTLAAAVLLPGLPSVAEAATCTSTIGVGLAGTLTNGLHGSWCNYSAWDIGGTNYNNQAEYKLVGSHNGTYNTLWGYVSRTETRDLYDGSGNFVGQEGRLDLIIDYYCSTFGGYLKVATLTFRHLVPSSMPPVGTYLLHVKGQSYADAPTIARPIKMSTYPVYHNGNKVSTGPHMHVEISALHNNHTVTYPSLSVGQSLSFGQTLYTFKR